MGHWLREVAGILARDPRPVIVGGLLGIFVGPAGSASRTMMARLAPPEQRAAIAWTQVPPGTLLCIRQGAAGQVTLSPGSGVTFASSDNLLSTRTQSAQIAVIADGGNAFGVIGERNAPSLGVALLAQANVFTKAQTVTPVALTDAASIATDASLSNTFTVTLGGSRTLANPTNMTNGAIYNWRVKQDGTGSRTLAYGSKFKWPGGTAPTLTTTANATDFISGQYFSDTDTILCTCLKGFA